MKKIASRSFVAGQAKAIGSRFGTVHRGCTVQYSTAQRLLGSGEVKLGVSEGCTAGERMVG